MSSARVYGIFTGRSAPLGPGGVPSGFVKKRARSAVGVSITGFEGDEQADLRVHGGPDMAIYAYNRAHYEAWQAEYPEHVELWGDGALGENLAMGGWDETDVCIGDVVHLGRAILQVTRPRKPCFKLALRFDDLRLPRRLTETGRCGWYYRVLKAGMISEGDEALLASRLHSDWSIRRVNDISIQAEPDLADLRELAGLPELAGNWRAQVEATAIARAAAARKNSFRKFSVVKIMDESASVRSFEIAPADGEGIAPAVAGQHVVVKGGFGGGKASRPYSISAITNTHLQISVKREKGGFSEWLHDAVSAGDHLEILGPRGSFRLDTATGRPVVLISAGIGITPMMAMIQAATTNNGSKVVPSSISFLHCTRDSSQQTFKSQLADIAMRHPAVTFHTRFSRPLSSDQIGRSHDSVGRIDKALVTQIVAPLGACNVYVCGPDAFMTDVRTWIEELGIPGIRVMIEAFGAADGKAANVRSRTRPKRARVTFARTGRVFEMNDAGSLLDLAEAEGVTVESDCRSGICGTCVATIVSGEVGYDSEPTISVEENQVLLCCGFPVADQLVLDL